MDQITQPIKRMGAGKIAVYIVLILALSAVAIISIVRDRIVNYPQNSVSVTGQGKVTYQPDIAIITLGVQIDKVAKPDEALNQLNDKITKIVAAIKALGIATEDIVTQSYSLYPQYDYVNNVSSLSGYSANQQITVKARDIKVSPDKTSKVIAEASKAGANQVLGISFDVSNLDDLKQQARVEALGDANNKAIKMASAAEVKLGEITGWWENYLQGPGQSQNYYGGSDKGGLGGGGSVSATIPTGSYEIVMEMNVNYKLK
ncbi:MAG: SIMPL domain-containing protein [Candidatus Buchananbacteria bacterium]